MKHNTWVVLVLFSILIPLLIGSCAICNSLKPSRDETVMPQVYLGIIEDVTADLAKLEQGEYEEIIILTNGNIIYIDTETEELSGYYFPGNELWYWEDSNGKHYRGVSK